MQHEAEFVKNQLLILDKLQSGGILLETATEVLLRITHFFNFASDEQAGVHDLSRVVHENTFLQIEPLQICSCCADHFE